MSDISQIYKSYMTISANAELFHSWLRAVKNLDDRQIHYLTYDGWPLILSYFDEYWELLDNIRRQGELFE